MEIVVFVKARVVLRAIEMANKKVQATGLHLFDFLK